MKVRSSCVFGASLLAIALSIAASDHARAELPPPGDPASKPTDPATTPNPPPAPFGGLIGLSMSSAAEYLGSDRRSTSVRPLAAIRYGRLRLATSGGGTLLDVGTEGDASGASLDLVQSARWQLRAGLRIAGGRDSSDSAWLVGIPNVRKTALGRISATYILNPNWHLGTTVNADLLGRGTGVYMTTGADFHTMIAPRTRLQIGGGVTVANATHLNSFYGVPESARTATRPAYAPGAGLKDAGIGLTVTTALDMHWVMFGGLRYNILLGEAADSPLTRRRADVAATLGIAWRWRH